ncbi:permease [Methylobacterium sp. P1-11]|uniref:LysE family translocator n=1 Tax=Methylobacterium sp. P1-11 TaxID=2024616 RepID=UPI0011EDDE0C|nr:LysE family transporter [Methylobacterium sp. P1-11]KAA0114932.1 permease [Methylobacterium sp. P1-11]
MGVIAAALLAGASLGLSIAVPIGPTSLLCIQRTLSGGLPIGLATGLGVATVHLTYGTVILRWGADLVAAWSNGAVLSLVSGAVLLALAVRVVRSDSVLHVSSERRDSLAASYGSAVVLALANPITPVLFLAAMPALLARGTAPLPMLAAGVFLGSFAWWVVLNTAVSLFRRCVTSQVLNQLNKAAGLLLALLALSLLVRGLDGSTAGRLDNASASGPIGATGQPPGRL